MSDAEARGAGEIVVDEGDGAQRVQVPIEPVGVDERAVAHVADAGAAPAQQAGERPRLRQRRQVPLPAAFHIAIEIVRALDFAHSHNVVHRDVSPSNILISRAGEVKIGDSHTASTPSEAI